MLKEAWTLAIEALSWMEMQNLSERLALSRTIKQLGISDYNATRLAQSLVFETVRRRNFIDKFVNHAAKPHKIEEYGLGVQAFLRLYVYQLQLTKDQNGFDLREAENVSRLGRSILGWKAMQEVEPFLGKLLTQKPKTMFEGLSDERKVGLLTFHPTWFVKYCFRLFGRAETLRMFKTEEQQPSTYIRPNTLKTDESEILQKLAWEETKVQNVEQLRHVYRVLTTKCPLTLAGSFREGLFYIQDKASYLAVEVADPEPGMTVLDVCAAPGAKTTHVAQLMRNQGAIYSLDYSKRRMAVWKQEAARMGVENAEPIIADARAPLPVESEADIVLLDPPCTNTGSFGRVPSAKWRLTSNSIDRMAAIQRQMINSCAKNVKPGGSLVYSTSSITVEENEMIIEGFLKQHADFTLAETTPVIGSFGLRGLDKCQRLYPHVHQCSGSFVARLSRG